MRRTIAIGARSAAKRKRRSKRRRSRRGQEERKGGARLDQRTSKRSSASSALMRFMICPRRRSFCAAPAIRKERCFPGSSPISACSMRSRAASSKCRAFLCWTTQSQGELPKFRDVYNVIRKDNPRALPAKGRGKQAKSAMDPQNLPHLLGQAIEALYKHYETVYGLWEKEPELGRPPVFIVVCNNTSTSKLVYDWISGYEITEGEGDKEQTRVVKGALRLFSNVDENGRWLPRFRTLLIDSEQLESGEALSDDFRRLAGTRDRRIQARTAAARRSAQSRRTDRRRYPSRSHEHRRPSRPPWRRYSLRRLGVDAHRRLGRQHGDAHYGRARIRHPAFVRAGRRPRAAPRVLRDRSQDRAFPGRICRRSRRAVLLRPAGQLRRRRSRRRA